MVIDPVVRFRTFDRVHWVTVEEGGGAERRRPDGGMEGERVGARLKGLVVANRVDAALGAWQEFRVRAGDEVGTVGFQSASGAWVAAEPGGVLVANRIRPDDYRPVGYEAFRIEPGLEGGVGIRSVQWGTLWRAPDTGGGALEHGLRDAIGIDETLFADPAAALGARGGLTTALVGRSLVFPLRAEGIAFVDGAGYVAPLGAGCLYGLDTGRDPSALLDQYAGRGIQFVRVFAGHLAPIVDGRPTGRNQSPRQALERLPGLLDLCAARGFGLQVCAITDSALDDYDVGAHVEAIARLLPASAWLELINENEHGTQRRFSAADFRALEARARAAGFRGLITWGATLRGDELEVGSGQYSMAGGSFIDAHLLRDTSPGGTPMPWYHEACRTTEIAKVRDKYNVPGESGEPGRVEGKDNPRGFAYLLGAIGRGLGLATVFHSGGARDARALAGIELDALDDYVRGYQAINSLAPRAPLTFVNGHWGEAPIAGVKWYEPDAGRRVWRAMFFYSGNRGRLLLAGVPDSTRWREGFDRYANGWRFEAEVDRVPGAVVLELARN